MWSKGALVVWGALLLGGCSRALPLAPVPEYPYTSCRPRRPNIGGQQSLDSKTAWELPETPPVVVGPGRIQALYNGDSGTFSVHEFRPRKTLVVAVSECPQGLLPTRLGVTPLGDTAVLCSLPYSRYEVPRHPDAANIAYGVLSPGATFTWRTFKDSAVHDTVEGFFELGEQVAVLYRVRTPILGSKILVPAFKLALLPGPSLVTVWSQSHIPFGFDEVVTMFLSDGVLHIIIREREYWRERVFDIGYSLSGGALTTTELGQGNVTIVPGKLEKTCVAGGQDGSVSIAFPVLHRSRDAEWPDDRVARISYPTGTMPEGPDVFPSEEALCPPTAGLSRQGDSDNDEANWWRASLGGYGWVIAFPGEPLCKDRPATMRIVWLPHHDPSMSTPAPPTERPKQQPPN